MGLAEKILSFELKTVALRKVTDEHERELEQLKKEASKPVPAVRQDHKKKRMERVAEFYMKRGITKNKKQ